MSKATQRCVIIDNYDSFTYNLVHLFKELGAEIDVVYNDKVVLEDLVHYDRIILSPGPGLPSQAGKMLDVIRTYAGVKPILGVCLGHQAIAELFGGHLSNLSNVFHGICSDVKQCVNSQLFEGIPNTFQVGRYHSWAVKKSSFPSCLEVIAETQDGIIMALRHRQYNIYGIQFHPESVLTPNGKKIIENWLTI